uniref:Fibronectin type-III domain-containing protein n=1 Tax=Romanomermis culicivorax TaxID=13658 RepID=A0A915IFP2_ROMCU
MEQSRKLTKTGPSDNRLKIAFARGRHSGEYKCIAQTDVDKIFTTASVQVKDAPDAPVIMSVHCEDYKATLKWLAAYDNYAEITKYTIEYSTMFTPQLWTIILVQENVNPAMSTLNATINLSPWVNYTFRVGAENFYGPGEYGYFRHSFVCQTAPSFPYTNPTNIFVSGTIRDNLIVRWTPMGKEQWNAPGLYYIVYYRKENSDEPAAPWSERRIEDPFLAHTEIKELPIFTRYEVKVKAYNMYGESLEDPKIVVGYTGEEVFQVSRVMARCRYGTIELNSGLARFLHDFCLPVVT